MPKKALPGNIGFLPGAYREYQNLEASDADAFGLVQESLIQLGATGAPRSARPFHDEELGVPLGLTYWFPVGVYIVVFEPQSRMVMRSKTGSQTVRSVLKSGRDGLYTIWLIMSNRS